MATITLKNIPESLHERLKHRATRSRRSLNSEVLACLEKVVQSERVDTKALLSKARRLYPKIKGRLTNKALTELKAQGRP